MSEIKGDHHELWLFKLTQGDLTDEEIMQGFIRHYVRKGYTLSRVEEDLVDRARYGNVEQAMAQLIIVLQFAAEGRELNGKKEAE